MSDDFDDIFRRFDGPAEADGGSQDDCILQFGTEEVRVNLSADGAPSTIAEAFEVNAARLGTEPSARVRFRRNGETVDGNTRLESGVRYGASLQADKHGA